MTLVSIIMPTYNSARYIQDAIESVLSQTVEDWELEIVDDGSTDDTPALVRPYAEKYPNIHYTRFETNCGAAAARTFAIQKATGRYIAFLDSDDYWRPDKLERQIRFMQENDCAFSCTAYNRISEDDPSFCDTVYPFPEVDYRNLLLYSNSIGNVTAMYDQSKLGKYTVPNLRKRNDFALWLKILKDTPCCKGLPEPLATYRIRRHSMSHCKWALFRYHWQLYYKEEKLGLLRSAFFLLCWLYAKGLCLGLQRLKSSLKHRLKVNISLTDRQKKNQR